MKLDLYQIFYDSYQTQFLDRKCTWYQNDLLTPLFENEVILNLYRDGFYRNCSYFGVTSWRLHEKTGLSYDSIQSFILTNNADCYGYGHYPPSFGIMNSGRTYIHDVMDLVYSSGVVPFQNPGYDWVPCFCNYWIATPYIFETYMKSFFLPIHQFLSENETARKLLLEGYFIHRGKTYPRHTFVYEYLFGFFLFHNRHFRFKNIPNKIDTIGRPVNQVFSEAGKGRGQ